MRLLRPHLVHTHYQDPYEQIDTSKCSKDDCTEAPVALIGGKAWCREHLKNSAKPEMCPEFAAYPNAPVRFESIARAA